MVFAMFAPSRLWIVVDIIPVPVPNHPTIHPRSKPIVPEFTVFVGIGFLNVDDIAVGGEQVFETGGVTATGEMEEVGVLGVVGEGGE